jgi:hypothetical protein
MSLARHSFSEISLLAGAFRLPEGEVRLGGAVIVENREPIGLLGSGGGSEGRLSTGNGPRSSCSLVVCRAPAGQMGLDLARAVHYCTHSWFTLLVAASRGDV